MGAIFPGGRIPKIEPNDTQRNQWMAPSRPPNLAHRKLFYFCFVYLLFVYFLFNNISKLNFQIYVKQHSYDLTIDLLLSSRPDS